jgi:hypothetical protein
MSNLCFPIFSKTHSFLYWWVCEVCVRARSSVPMNIHARVTIRVYARLFVWVCAMNTFNKFSSGCEHVLYEPPRWKPGWRCTAGFKYGCKGHEVQVRPPFFCMGGLVHARSLNMFVLSELWINKKRHGILTWSWFCICAVPNGDRLVLIIVVFRSLSSSWLWTSMIFVWGF